MAKLIQKGDWNNNLSWKLYASDSLPKTELITAVFCLAIHNGRIVLMRAGRGWDMLGGHIEPGETVQQAMVREAQEEGGFTPTISKLYGYKEITAQKPVAHQNGTESYPFPVSYIVYYWTTTDEPLVTATGIEVLESKSFTLEEVKLLNHHDITTIELGWVEYLSSKTE